MPICGFSLRVKIYVGFLLDALVGRIDPNFAPDCAHDLNRLALFSAPGSEYPDCYRRSLQ